jgi:hypothetical protein
VLEVRIRGVSKALPVRETIASHEAVAIVAIGDDLTDEHMFDVSHFLPFRFRSGRREPLAHAFVCRMSKPSWHCCETLPAVFRRPASSALRALKNKRDVVSQAD